MKKITVSIGIPAHNEAANIGNLLADLLLQKTEKIIIHRIIVACDGCTDNTASIVKKISKKNKKIICIDDGKRLNQTGRLMQMYKMVKTDVFITFDGDTRLEGSGVVEALTRPFKDKKIFLVSGNDTPLPARNSFEKIVISSIKLWTHVRNVCFDLGSVHYVHGCVTAVRVSKVNKIKYPVNPSGNDAYLYFYIKNQGGITTYAKNAVVYYRAVGTLKEYFIQNSRFINSSNLINHEFGKNMYLNESVSLKNKIVATLQYLFKDPIYGSLSIVMQLSLRVLKPIFTRSNGSWTTISTTKI